MNEIIILIIVGVLGFIITAIVASFLTEIIFKLLKINQ